MTYLDTMTLYDNLSNRYSFWCFFVFSFPRSQAGAAQLEERFQDANLHIVQVGPPMDIVLWNHVFRSFWVWLSAYLALPFCTFSGLHHSFIGTGPTGLPKLSHCAQWRNARIHRTWRCVAVDSVDSLDLAGFAGSIVEALRDGKGGDSAPKRVRFGLAAHRFFLTIPFSLMY